MLCPKCNQQSVAALETVRADEYEPTVYIVVCGSCEAPLHFFQSREYQDGNLVNQIERVADALGGISDAIEKSGSH